MARELGLNLYDHRPTPGPVYWDWRCLICSQPIANHPGLIARLLYRWRNR